MAEREWRVGLILCSGSCAAVAQLVEELGGTPVEVGPEPGAPWPQADVLLFLGGGEEAAALELLAECRTTVPRFLVGAAADHRIAAAAVQSGAPDYFALPADVDLLRRSLERLSRDSESRAQAAEFAEAERHATGFEAILGSSAALRRALDQAARVAAHRDLTVLIGGETGTGKELLARALHYASPRAAQPFVEVNCAAIPANLLESELFGHERGAFTGAVAAKPGLFELADGGTLFLDEIGNLPLELQPKLLRALETRAIRRVGGQQARQVDVRVLAATHVDLAAAVRDGAFREDLYYRLNVVRLALPPLREREADIELLARTFVERIASGYGLPVPDLGADVLAALRAHRWPGNVRELRNDRARRGASALAHACARAAGGRREPALPPRPRPALPRSSRTLCGRRRRRCWSRRRQQERGSAAAGYLRPRLQRLLDGNLD
jgi:two-component system response regulator HydG